MNIPAYKEVRLSELELYNKRIYYPERFYTVRLYPDDYVRVLYEGEELFRFGPDLVMHHRRVKDLIEEKAE